MQRSAGNPPIVRYTRKASGAPDWLAIRKGVSVTSRTGPGAWAVPTGVELKMIQKATDVERSPLGLPLASRQSNIEWRMVCTNLLNDVKTVIIEAVPDCFARQVAKYRKQEMLSLAKASAAPALGIAVKSAPAKLWLSTADHRPLQAEMEQTAEVKPTETESGSPSSAAPIIDTQTKSVLRFRYDGISLAVPSEAEKFLTK